MEGKGGGGWLFLRVRVSASRCHHLKAFGSSESVRRVDLKCPLAYARVCTRSHISACKRINSTGLRESVIQLQPDNMHAENFLCICINFPDCEMGACVVSCCTSADAQWPLQLN